MVSSGGSGRKGARIAVNARRSYPIADPLPVCVRCGQTLLFLALLGSGSTASRSAKTLRATEQGRESSSMLNESALRDLFDRWERVWHEGQYDLIAQCVQPNYIRHDEQGDRTVTREAYAAEIARCGRSDRASGSLSMITHSRATVRGSVSRSSGLIQKPARRAAGQECSLPDRGRQARGDLAYAPTTRLSMDRRRCAGAPDKPAANQIGPRQPLSHKG